MEPAQPYGGFWRRVLAALIDLGVLGVGLTLVEFVLYNAWQETFGSSYESETGMGWLMFLIGLLAAGLYCVGFEADRGATLGKQALGLRVVRPDGSRPGWVRMAARWLLHVLSLAAAGVGFLMPLWTKKRQTLHDLIADTIVIRV